MVLLRFVEITYSDINLRDFLFHNLSVPIGSYYPYFSVNETSGSVTVIRKLDRESSAVVNITVKAVDASQTNNVTCYGPDGTPVVVANTTTQILIITITDANDNPPVFLRKDYDTGIRKNVKILTSIFDLAVSFSSYSGCFYLMP